MPHSHSHYQASIACGASIIHRSALSQSADLPAHGLTLFRAIFSLVYTIFNALVRFYHAHPEHDRLRTVCLAIECLSSLLVLEYTLHSAPERITPRQLFRLAKAARALTRLTGQSFDFTPWTSLTPSELDLISPKPEPNPLTEYRIRIPEIRMPPSGNGPIGLCQHPGATLANVIRKLARILPPDFTPEAFSAPAPSANPQSEIRNPQLSPSPSQSHSQSDLNGMESPSPSQSISFPSSASPIPHSAFHIPHLPVPSTPPTVSSLSAPSTPQSTFHIPP